MRAKILAVVLLCVASTPTYAQFLNPVTPLDGGTPVGAGNPLHVTGSFSASLGGFVPSLSYTTLTATASSSASTALPTNTGTVAFQNQTAVAVSCTLASGSATATTNEIIVPAGSTIFIGTTGYDHAACINQTGSASNVIILAGGTGLGTGFGGGGSGGGGGAVTLASGAVASGAYSSGSIASGAFASGAIGSGAVASGAVSAGAYAAGAVIAGAFVDGWDLTQGTKADVAWVSGSGSVIALLKNIAGGVAGSIPAGSALIGKVGIDQTTPGTTNAVSVQYGSTASIADPCQTATKVYTPVNVVTSANVTIAGVSAKKKYICGIFLYPGATVNFAVFQATTGSSCASGLTDIFGGHTTGTGFLATATAGFVAGNGASAFAATTTVDTDICVANGGSVQLSGVVVTVDQ